MYEFSEHNPEDDISYFDPRICVIGLGHEGLSLTKLFSTKFQTIGFDLDQTRVAALMYGNDSAEEKTGEFLYHGLHRSLTYTSEINQIRNCNFYIIAVPPKQKKQNGSDLESLWCACEIVGQVISGGNVVVYDTCFSPGFTKDECIPVIEKVSGLTCNSDFFAGYCPDSIHHDPKKQQATDRIRKITSGSTPEIGRMINEIYAAVLSGGTLPASSTREADAATAF